MKLCPPKRLVIIPSKGNNAATLSAVSSALQNRKIKESVNSIVLVFDDECKKGTDWDKLKNYLLDFQISIQELEIPNLNDILDKRINYEPEVGDCLLIPAVQKHQAIMMNILSKEFESDSHFSHFYLCLTTPDFRSIDWTLVKKSKSGSPIVEKFDIENKQNGLIEWYFDEEVDFERPEKALTDSDFDLLVSSELEATNMSQWISEYNIQKRTGLDELGFAFEALVSDCFLRSENIDQVISNVEFSSNKKELKRREEDIIALTKSGDLIVASCKFYRRDTSRAVNELNRIKNESFGFRIPRERLIRILVTTSNAVKDVKHNSQLSGIYSPGSLNNYLAELN